MGCASSKRIEASVVDVYRPAPTSLAVFDINAIEEPWLMSDDAPKEHQEKHALVPATILEKLQKLESDAPYSWDEVSKALEDLKPALQDNGPAIKPLNSEAVTEPAKMSADVKKQIQSPTPKSLSFHTVEELDVKSSKQDALKKTESLRAGLKKNELHKLDLAAGTDPTSEGYKPVRQNMFILMDRLEREKEGKASSIIKRDPLSDYPEKCPPGGQQSLVLYTTSLRGIRRTYEDCNRVRAVLEGHGVVFDERDVSLHGEFLNELKELVGEGASVPRMFVMGRYLGGVEEVINLNETGRLGRLLNWARVERGVGRQACEGCGGARFVPCLECGGSCKVVNGDSKERCPACNENGLAHCPYCL